MKDYNFNIDQQEDDDSEEEEKRQASNSSSKSSTDNSNSKSSDKPNYNLQGMLNNTNQLELNFSIAESPIRKRQKVDKPLSKTKFNKINDVDVT